MLMEDIHILYIEVHNCRADTILCNHQYPSSRGHSSFSSYGDIGSTIKTLKFHKV